MQETQPSLISKEQENIQKDMEMAMTTEGFSRLTEKQQHIIKLSLYMQARAGREIERWKLGNDRTYISSYDYVSERNCHSAIFSLEKENMRELSEDAKADTNFFKAEYNTVATIDELKRRIEEFGFPCVLHIGRSSSDDAQAKEHSSLVLGHDNAGNIVLWEKESYEAIHPYQITHLNNIYDTYGNIRYYGLRKLRSGLENLSESKTV